LLAGSHCPYNPHDLNAGREKASQRRDLQFSVVRPVFSPDQRPATHRPKEANSMADANWRARRDELDDPSDPSSNNIFENRDKAIRWLVAGILTLVAGSACAAITKYATFLSEDDKLWFEGTSVICWMGAFVEISLSVCAIVWLRRRPLLGKLPPAKSPFGDDAQRPTAPPPIGW